MSQRLAELRRSKGLSQEELAAELGLSRQAVSNWERAEASPDTDNLIALARFYGVPLDHLVSGQLAACPLSEQDVPAAATEASPVRRLVGRAYAAWFAATFVLSYAYYAFAAQPLVMSTMDDMTAILGLRPSSALALLWLAGECVAIVLPCLAVAITARYGRFSAPSIWLAPAVACGLYVALPVASALLAGSPYEYPGIGGGLLAPSVAVKADVLGIVVGAALVVYSSRRAIHQTSAST